MAKIAAADISLASEEPVLHYTGKDAPGNVPARDLNAGDLARIHRIHALQESGGEPVAAARPMDMAAVANELLDSPAFSTRAPAEPKAKASPKKKTAKPKAVAPVSAPVATPEAPAVPAEENA